LYSSNLRLINDLRFVNDTVVVLSPIERIPPFDAVLSALLAEYEGHGLPAVGCRTSGGDFDTRTTSAWGMMGNAFACYAVLYRAGPYLDWDGVPIVV